MGELTDVASAKRAVRGVLMDNVEELEDEVRDRTVTSESFFSSMTLVCCGVEVWITSEPRIGRFDIFKVVRTLRSGLRAGIHCFRDIKSIEIY